MAAWYNINFQKKDYFSLFLWSQSWEFKRILSKVQHCALRHCQQNEIHCKEGGGGGLIQSLATLIVLKHRYEQCCQIMRMVIMGLWSSCGWIEDNSYKVTMLDVTGVWGRQRYLFFYNFMNGRGIQKTEELNGWGPKNDAQIQRGIKIKPWIIEWKGSGERI